MEYGYSKKINMGFDEAIYKLKSLLKDNGFGVLCEIDVGEKIINSLGKDIDKYQIIGACNPHFAYEAIKTEKEVGLLLPCNIIVYVEQGETFVSTILPTKLLSFVDNNKLNEIAKEVEAILNKVIDDI